MKSFLVNFPLLIVLSFSFVLISMASEIYVQDETESLLRARWTTDDGLPQNTVNKIVQTQDGYIWIATWGGLTRFDGVKFTIFNSANTPEIKNNRIVSLIEDKNGILWIGTEAGEIISYKNGIFTPSLQLNNAAILFSTNENGLWVYTKGNLALYDSTDFTIRLSISLFETYGDNVKLIWDFGANKPWLSNDSGLFRFENGQFSLFQMPSEISSKILFIQTLSQNRFCLISLKGIGILENGVYKHRQDIDFGNFETNRHTLLRTASQIDGSFWVNYENKIYQITENDIKTFNTEGGLQQKPYPKTLLIDREGNIWFGTDGFGLIRFRKKQIRLFGLIDDKKFWKSTSSIIQSPDGTVWVASTFGLTRIKNQVTTYFSEKDGLSSSIINSLAFDKKGVLWIGTANGLTKFEDGKFTKIPNPPSNLRTDFSINVLFFDKDNSLWIGYRGLGIAKFQNEGFTAFNKNQGLIGNEVHCIFQDREDTIWIGTSTGLSRLKDGVFTNFTTENGLSNNYIRDIYEENNGTLWLGTYGGGIVRYSNNVFKPITRKEGLSEDIASRLIDDGKGNFWVLGNQGVYSVNRKDLNDVADGKIKSIYCITFGKTDGMRVSEGNGGNQPAGWKTQDGNIWFPMIEGGIIITPKPTNNSPPPVYIENIFLAETPIAKTNKIIIPPAGERIEIQYTGLSFTKPEQVQFRYKLEGFENDWIYVGTRRAVNFNFLPPGNYRFYVQAMNSDGVWSENAAALEIRVEAPFWRTWWFFILSLLFLLLIAYIVIKIRFNQIEEARKWQQEFSRQLLITQETERQRIAAELHDGIGQDLLIIKNRALLGLSKKKNTKLTTEQLEEISETATHALNETRTIARNLRPLHLQRFGFTYTLESMIVQIQNSSGIEFQTAIDNIDNIFDSSDELSIFRIIQECSNNIVKHSETTQAILEVVKSTETVKILIEDKGKGFDMNSSDSNRKNGFGLSSIEQRVKILGGTINISSTIGIGTNITIFFNLPNGQKS